MESVAKAVLMATCIAGKPVIFDGNISTDTVKCGPAHVLNSVSRCLTVMLPIGQSGFIYRRMKVKGAGAVTSGSSRAINVQPELPAVLASSSVIEQFLDDPAAPADSIDPTVMCLQQSRMA